MPQQEHNKLNEYATIRNSDWVQVLVRVIPDPLKSGQTMLYVSYDGMPLTDGIALNSWNPQTDWDFAFGALANDNNWIDNLQIVRASTGQDAIESLFDSSEEAWSVVDMHAASSTSETNPRSAQYDAISKSLYSDTEQSSSQTYFKAPTKFLGNRGDYYDGSISWSVRMASW